MNRIKATRLVCVWCLVVLCYVFVASRWHASCPLVAVKSEFFVTLVIKIKPTNHLRPLPTLLTPTPFSGSIHAYLLSCLLVALLSHPYPPPSLLSNYPLTASFLPSVGCLFICVPLIKFVSNPGIPPYLLLLQ